MLRRVNAVIFVLVAACGTADPPTNDGQLQEFLAAAFAYLFEHNDAHAAAGPYEAICVNIGAGDTDPQPSLVKRFRGYRVPVVPGSACVFDPEYETNNVFDGTLVQQETGKPAISITVWPPDRLDELVTFKSTYYEDPLSSAEYQCTAQHQAGVWRILSCEVETIS